MAEENKELEQVQDGGGEQPAEVQAEGAEGGEPVGEPGDEQPAAEEPAAE